MRLAASAGGTGGHVYPALTVIEALLEPRAADSQPPSLDLREVLWIGGRGGIEEEMVRQAGVKFTGLAAGGLRGMALLTTARNAAQIAGSVAPARSILLHFKPDVVFVTGGYACVAVTLAARTLRIPVVIYLPDVVPGLAIRFLSRFAARIAVTSEQSVRFFRRDKVLVTGYPVRSDILKTNRAEARQALSLDLEEPTVLVFGGSRGARSINQALVSGLRRLLPVCQIVHISGRVDADWVANAAKSLPEPLQRRYHHYAYLHDMPSALVAADLAVARAGAATLGEFPAASLPALLVPYPHSGQHQQPNADYLASHGVAKVLSDPELGERLVPGILELLNDRQSLARMRLSARALARPDAAQAIAEELRLVALRRVPKETGVQR